MGKGKSPGKWFRNLLLGKKSSSKSNQSKKNDIFKPLSNKDVLGPSEVSVSDPTVDSSLISTPMSGVNASKGVLAEKEVVSRSSRDRVLLSTGDEEANAQAAANFGSREDLEKVRLTEAAIKAQAAFRGYQARRTFRTLKGIIQLQALIRGHLVRRQAICALYCVKGIVKFQALARGYKVRRSGIGLAVQKMHKDTKCSSSNGVVTSTQVEKLSESVFVHTLLSSSSSAVPLYLNYIPGEPNLAWEWLDRWTRSHFWAPLSELKKKLDSVSDEKNGSCKTVGTKEGQVKRKTRKSPTVKVDDSSISDSNKYKRHPKKDSNHQLLSAKEHPEKEIQNSNFKKTCMQNVSDRYEVVNEKRKHNTRKISDHTVTDVSEQGPSASSEKMKDLAVPKSKESDPEKRKAGTRKLSDHTVTDDSEQGPSASSEKMKVLAAPKSKESDPEKRKHSTGKISDHTITDVSDHPVKVSDHTVTDVNEKRKHSTRKISDHTLTDVSEQGTSASSEKMKDLAVPKSKESDPEKSLGQQAEDEHDNESHNNPIAVLQMNVTNGRDEGTQGVSGDLNGADNCIRKNCQRRASLPANFNDQDNELHNTPRLPSYMAPTESAKAKLRGHGSPRFASDSVDKNSITRRHSLSSSLNGKSGSFSPRAERLVAMSSRGVIRTDRSLSSSRDGTDKLIQPQWRR